ncbi:hypothetical protein [Pedobacter sp. ASV28]|uniref:hypothetical protein n=1 Tax=Pedobacter sp. ASV28 TaxID=2795123 RepID=UPI0018EB4D17|nr:hypothetical protein [Pedobacter sp. ASV28]
MGKSLGVILMAIGLILLIWTGFTYTKKEKVVDAGPIEITADREKTVQWPPYLGGIAILVGVFVYIAAKRKT